MSFFPSQVPVLFAIVSAVAVSTGCSEDDTNDGQGSASLQGARVDLRAVPRMHRR